MNSGTLKGALLAAAATVALAAGPAFAQDVSACLITKTETNPFFVKMREGAQAKADELGVKLTALAGREDGDNEGQVAAIESCIADGVNGILLVPSDSAAIVDTVKLARDNGIMVIALDTPLDPIDAADATLATDNFKAGELIGAWAKAQLGDKAADAKIAYLDLSPVQPTVDVLRDQGFMQGFGIDLGDPKRIGDETDPRNVCHDVTNGNPEGGRKAMENCLQKDPDINVVYTINEPAAAGALRGAEGRRQGDRRAARLGRRRLPGRQGRRGRRDRRDLAAVSAADGLDGHRGDQEVRRQRREARRDRGPRLLRHRRGARHRQAGRGHRVDHHRGGPGEVLGLTG